jgi:hypothetical protein
MPCAINLLAEFAQPLVPHNPILNKTVNACRVRVVGILGKMMDNDSRVFLPPFLGCSFFPFYIFFRGNPFISLQHIPNHPPGGKQRRIASRAGVSRS